MKSKLVSLKEIIQKSIINRIVISIIIIFIIPLSQAALDIIGNVKHIKDNVRKTCSSLENFTIGQSLVGNDIGAEMNLSNFNESQDNIKVIWIKKPYLLNDKSNFKWHFPFNWTYDYNFRKIGDGNFGYLHVTGKFSFSKDQLCDFLIQFLILFSISMSIFMLLYPIMKKLPQNLIISPINNLLKLLESKKNSFLDKYESNTNVFEIKEMEEKIIDLLKTVDKRSKHEAIFEISAQVAHDIRSPLMVLKTVLSDLSSLPERKRIDARNAIQRVTDIANNLLLQYRQEYEKSADTLVEFSSEPVAIMLESIVSEKRIQIVNCPIEINHQFPSDMYSAFIFVDIIGFKRVLSNLMNNAIEAFQNGVGVITIQLSKNNGKIIVDVKDNGCGISEEKLNSLLKEGGTFGKKEGSGLGLPYAISKITEWHGDYSLTSKQGEGTRFEIILPEAESAYWFKSKIDLIGQSTIIVLDDDEYIHQIWNERFPESLLLENHLHLLHFKDPNDLILFFKNHSISNTTFFVDYELGNECMTGLEVVKELDIGAAATVVTRRCEDEDVRNACQILGMQIIPKFFAELIPIHIINPTEIVLIDNDEIIRFCWQESAEGWGKSLNVFHDPEDFMKMARHYPKDTLIYIDSLLDNGVKGEDFAKTLYECGYVNLILATGHPKFHFASMSWIKDIVGKEPPWGKSPRKPRSSNDLKK